MTTTSEKDDQAEQPVSTAPSKKSSRKSTLVLAVIALGINTTAAVYTLSPSDFALPNNFALPNISSLAEWLPQQKVSVPIPDPVVAALKDIQSAQQQHAASLLKNSSLLQQNTALLRPIQLRLPLLDESVVDEQFDTKKIAAQISDEHHDMKKMSAQISTLIAKVNSLQNAITPEVTSSISTRRAYNQLSPMRKRMARQPRPVGPVSVGGAPLTTPTPQG